MLKKRGHADAVSLCSVSSCYYLLFNSCCAVGRAAVGGKLRS